VSPRAGLDAVENAFKYQKWLNHVIRMEDIRYTKQLVCRPIGRPLYRLRDEEKLEAEIGHLLS
jgi:hypothetical protein